MRLNKQAATHYREVADRYKRATRRTVIEVREVIAWAMRRGELELSPDDQVEVHAGRMSEALRTDATRDQLGRKVRLRHCVTTRGEDANGKPEEKHLWSHVNDADDDHLITALTQRREDIVRDVESLRADLDFINAMRAERGKRPIQMSFDFTENGDDLGQAS